MFYSGNAGATSAQMAAYNPCAHAPSASPVHALIPALLSLSRPC